MSRFGLSERTAIEAGIYRRASFSQIAKEIGSTARSVSAEIRRNRTLSIAPKFNGKDCRFATEFVLFPAHLYAYPISKHTGMSWLLWTSWWLPWSRKASPWLTFILRTETKSRYLNGHCIAISMPVCSVLEIWICAGKSLIVKEENRKRPLIRLQTRNSVKPGRMKTF